MGKINNTILSPTQKAFRFFEGAFNLFGIILDEASEDACVSGREHSGVRIWLSEDWGKYICGGCGAFVYIRKKRWDDFIAWFFNFFGAQCLACLVVEAHKKRDKLSLTQWRVALDAINPEFKLKHNHNLRCKIRNSVAMGEK